MSHKQREIVKDTSKQFASFSPTNFIVVASSDFLELGAIQRKRRPAGQCQESKTEELAKETQNPVANLGYYADSCNIPLTEYCRVVLGQLASRFYSVAAAQLLRKLLQIVRRTPSPPVSRSALAQYATSPLCWVGSPNEYQFLCSANEFITTTRNAEKCRCYRRRNQCDRTKVNRS